MPKALKNPGYEAPTMLDFDELPSLAEFLRDGGMPGVEYLYLLPQEQMRAQKEGWGTIAGMPFFTVRGVAMTCMARGRPVPGAAPGSAVCPLHVSNQAQKMISQSLEVPAESDVDPKLGPAEQVLERALKKITQPAARPTA